MQQFMPHYVKAKVFPTRLYDYVKGSPLNKGAGTSISDRVSAKNPSSLYSILPPMDCISSTTFD